MKTHIDHLQDQVNSLFANINDLHRKTESPAGESSRLSREVSRSLSSHQPTLESHGVLPAKHRTKHPRFHGPTSSAFNFDVAKSSLQTMGITQTDDGTQEIFSTQDATPAQTPPTEPTQSPFNLTHPNKDPLWAVRREEAVRLCRVYEEEIGLMYPIYDVENMVAQINLLYNFIEAADRTGLTKRFNPGPDCLSDDDTCILKMILAVTLNVEGNGQSALGAQFYAGVKHKVETNLWKPADIKAIKLFTLVVSTCI